MRLHRRVCGAAFAVALSCSHAQEPKVLIVQPSGAEVPANLLRMSIRFATPIESPLLPRLALLNSDGKPIDAPFLEQELWSPDGEVLTILLHPGRVKTGLNARAERGPILSAGENVTLTLDGLPIKRWSVGDADDIGPEASAWKLSAVRVASKQPLTVTLDGPVDGRDADYLAIADPQGNRVAGRARLSDGENRWSFTPTSPWRAGTYKLVARGTLEDSAGNRLDGHFETTMDSPPEYPLDAGIPFVVKPSER